MQGSPAATAPTPRQASLAPPPLAAQQPTASIRTTTSGIHLENPTTEATRALALCSGPNGLVETVERDLLKLVQQAKRAYEGTGTPADPHAALASLSALISLLSRSALGGFVPPSSSSQVPSSAAPSGTVISQAQLDQASERSQALFKELQAVRERAEVVRAGLAR
ncbi:hypothetical protein BMF94_1991 [Rhodotorula taiwanensis]|uniref:Uncharacterized protein n=1 Tax=Rhodotorula taiwanensis TaxID=741276 RepID=A0A2S5BE12_9BASI|nr:hypothetical protein BMF94_1991 [Rhodotorula taiwanensis]